MIIWGVKDNDSWRSGSNPLLYDSGMGKKKAWYAVRSALRHRDLVNQQTDIRPAISTKVTNGNRYNLAGQKVGTDYIGIVIVDGKKMMSK